ncbi:hypothetical protein BD289DRAFT_1273 [Coniella lustricola]|uniref:Secreted protein n=1 Tax=Coniella lustricola TaxID=2025994 RepID=A0A2T3ANC9_9PEZI|nr:hypothetical protein BD289DRAFT_1273 [Coniella lustricola]
MSLSLDLSFLHCICPLADCAVVAVDRCICRALQPCWGWLYPRHSSWTSLRFALLHYLHCICTAPSPSAARGMTPDEAGAVQMPSFRSRFQAASGHHLGTRLMSLASFSKHWWLLLPSWPVSLVSPTARYMQAFRLRARFRQVTAVGTSSSG